MYKTSPEKRKKALERYYLKKEEILKQQKEYRENNLEICKERTRNWYKRNISRVEANCAEYRARKRAQTLDSKDTHKVFSTLREVCRWLEILTETKWHVDHIKPLNKGGLHHYTNFQILPQRANLIKSDKYGESTS